MSGRPQARATGRRGALLSDLVPRSADRMIECDEEVSSFLLRQWRKAKRAYLVQVTPAVVINNDRIRRGNER